MDKGAIEKFAINARLKLRQSVSQRLTVLGIGTDGTLDPVQVIGDVAIINLANGMETRLTKNDSAYRDQLIKEIRNSGYDNVVESVAYTWFNRLIAIRYMEVNDYLPTHARVLSSSVPGKKEPDLLTQCLSADFDYSQDERKQIIELKNNEELDRLFMLMFVIQCRELNKILPELFTATKQYEKLLLNLSFTDPDGVIRDLVDSVPEDDFKDAVQIIGWMYQYYNKELKDDTFAKLKKNVKVSKERIPAVTQLFTPDWIVRYMVENSVGRVWLEGHDDSQLKASWRYYLDEAEQEADVKTKLDSMRIARRNMSPEDITVIDPCMGSGHILVYAFDVLMQIYQSYGYSRSNAAISIVEKNLYGLDIDDRAYQLAYFAVMMKARQYNADVFNLGVKNNIYSIPDSGSLNKESLKGYGTHMSGSDRSVASSDLEHLFNTFRNGKTFGSLIKLGSIRYDLVDIMVDDRTTYLFDESESHELIKTIVSVAKTLSQYYDVVITNPPYMGSSGMESLLLSFVKDNYPDTKSDLFACFIERCGSMARKGGYYSMITQHAFMFLSSFEKLRIKLKEQALINMAHLGPRAFDEIGGEVVQSTSFVLQNLLAQSYVGTYLRLVEGNSESEKERMFLTKEQVYTVKQDIFSKIPGAPIAYWMSEKMGQVFDKGVALGEIASPRQGLATADNNRFLRLWYEVDINDVHLDCTSIADSVASGKKWFPHNKGGEYRRWYGNNDYVINWENDGEEIRNFKDDNGKLRSVIRNPDYYFKPCITYSDLTSGLISARYSVYSTFDVTGPSFISNDAGNLFYIAGFINSIVAQKYLDILCAGLHYSNGVVAQLPLMIGDKDEVVQLVSKAISLLKNDWDLNETSHEFEQNCLLKKADGCVSDSILHCIEDQNHALGDLKMIEERINTIFIDLFELSDQIDYTVDDKLLSLKPIKREKMLIQLISYAVGCMFGRYSIDKKGLRFAGGSWKPDNCCRYSVDVDNIIPINDDEYFGDDIVSRFVEFITVAFGKEKLEENLRFIADNLNIKGSGTSRDKIRTYFLKDFYKDHLQMYQKRPIYWLFDSGKENGFKALIYMHRYEPNLVGKMRQNYLLPMQRRYVDQMNREKDQVKRGTLQKKLSEVERYDLAMELYSSNPVSIDLDDGVKVNYAKFQNIECGESSKDRIDLLYRI